MSAGREERGMSPSRRRRPFATRRRLLALGGAALVGSLAGCTAASGGGTEPTVLAADRSRETPDAPEDDLAELVRENAGFALDLLRQQTDGGAGNLFFSPYSVSLALAMTWAGARGDTETRMAETLRYTLGQERLHPAFNALDRRVEGTNGENSDGTSTGNGGDDGRPFTLRTANALWGQEEYPFRDAYLDVLAANYGAGVHAVDFAGDPDGARRAVNAWVGDATEGQIEELLARGVVTELTRFVLTNAVYFEADWRDQFEKRDTSREAFTAVDGAESQVPTMHQRGTFPYAAVDGAQVVELPYVGDAVGMVVVLPPAGEFEAFESSLDADGLLALTDALESRAGRLALPKFAVDAKLSLADALSSLGMPAAFDPAAADFGGMVDESETGEPLYLQAVVHQCRVKVDEEGTEAAAATGVVGGTTSAPADPFEMNVNRPFLAFVRHRSTNAVLFLGRVVDAKAAQ